jgi:hypothetical protein
MILVLNWPCDRCEYESTNGFNSLSIFPMLELSKRSESLFYVEEMWFSACTFFRSETSGKNCRDDPGIASCNDSVLKPTR